MLLFLTLVFLSVACAADPVVLTFPGATPASGSLKARPTTVYKPRSLDAFHRARWRSLNLEESERVEWDPQEVLGPDIEDLHTLAQLARMSGNAYAVPGKKNWYEIDSVWNTVRSTIMELWNCTFILMQSFPFGWEDPENGFRGHVFMSSDNATVILSIKGTTLQGPTSKQDKYNDNLLVLSNTYESYRQRY